MVSLTSSFLFTCLFILISWGWSIKNYDVESFELFFPVAFLVGFFKLLIYLIGKLDNDDENKFHDFHGLTGVFICLIRFGLYIYFLFGINDLSTK